MKSKVCVITSTGKRVCGRLTSRPSGTMATGVSQAHAKRQMAEFTKELHGRGFGVGHMSAAESGVLGPNENLYVDKPVLVESPTAADLVQLWWEDGKYSVIVSHADGRVLSEKTHPNFPAATAEFLSHVRLPVSGFRQTRRLGRR